MSPTKSFFVFFSVAAIAAVLVSCGGSEQPAEPTTSAVMPVGRQIDPATAGSVMGTIKLEGTPPRMRAINMVADPVCAGMHPQRAMTENVVTGDDGALQNVFVYLRGDFSDYAVPASTTPAELDQRGCTFHPHVLGMQTSQPLTVRNSDQTTHNVHPVPMNNREWNETQPPRGGAPVAGLPPRRDRDSGEVQHPSVDAELRRCAEQSVFSRDRPGWTVQPGKCASWKLYRRCVA